MSNVPYEKVGAGLFNQKMKYFRYSLIAISLLCLVSSAALEILASKRSKYVISVPHSTFIADVVSLKIWFAAIVFFLFRKSERNAHMLLYGAPFIFAGIFIEIASFYKLGIDCSFYSEQFSTGECKHVDSFPFNIGHPEFKGMILIIIGIYFLIKPSVEFSIICLVWTSLYFIRILAEEP